MFKWNLMCFSSCLVPFVLSLGTTERNLAPSSSFPFIRCLHTLGRSPQSFLFSGKCNISRSSALRHCENVLGPVLCWAQSQLKTGKQLPLPLVCKANLPLDPELFALCYVFNGKAIEIFKLLLYHSNRFDMSSGKTVRGFLVQSLFFVSWAVNIPPLEGKH